MWSRKRDEPETTRKLVASLTAGLEAGRCDGLALDKVLAELKASPEKLLPAAGGEVIKMALLLWKSGRSTTARPILFSCLSWYLRSGDQETVSLLTQSIQHYYEQAGRSVSVEEIHRAARAGDVAVEERQPPTGPARVGRAGFRRFSGWFLERGESWERDILCPDCGWESTFLPRDEYPPAECPKCGYGGARIPFTKFEGWLKFHNPAQLTPAANAVMTFCCPGFLSQEASEEAKNIRARRLAESGVVTHIAAIPAHQARHRRWSGDSRLAHIDGGRLSRGSYYGVCQGPEGDDRGGVALELAAYRNPVLSGRVGVYDLNFANNADALQIPKSQSFAFIFDVDRFRAWCESELFDQCNFKSQSGMVVAVIPYQVEHRLIENVVDLRRKPAQDWLYETFRNGYPGFWEKPLAGELSNFFSMFPAIFEQTLGGSDETQFMGYWLRTHGVEALVYPSARCNAALICQGEEPESWFGWNLVDFRPSSVPVARGQFYDVGAWPSQVPPGCSMQFQNHHSWCVTGFQEAQDRAYEKKLTIIEKGFEPGTGWCFERHDAGTGEKEALCVNLFCDWTFRGLASTELGAACPACGSRLRPPSQHYTDFGAFLNAVVDTAIADFGIEPVVVRRRIDDWLDRQHLAEYSGKCASGECTDLDVVHVAGMIDRSIKSGTRF
jgi:hypothetical protein